MFFAVFGSAWLVAWCHKALGPKSLVLIPIFLGGLLVLGAAIRQYQANRSALEAEADTPDRKRASRVFNWVNGTQWVLVFIAVNVVNNLGHPEWFIPAFIFIVGAHFLPLASAFKVRRHWVTGLALILLSLLYPQVAKQGAASPVGCLGAGLILWLSALGGVLPERWAA